MRKGFAFLTVIALVSSILSPTSMAKTGEFVQGTGINSTLKFAPDEDYDHDGLTNQKEDDMGLNILEEDTDYDQIRDGDEVSSYTTDPTKSDSDHDGLDDGDELFELNQNPLDPDQNKNGIEDGKETRTVPLIKNDFGIKGNVTGVGSIYGQYSMEQNPIIMLNKINTIKTIYFDTLNKGLLFNVEIPVHTKLDDPLLLIYRHKSGQLKPVKTQQYEQEEQVITAEFKGGGTLVVVSEKAYQTSKIPANANLTKLSKVPIDQNIQIAGIPGLTISQEMRSQRKTDRKGKAITDPNIIIFKEKRQFRDEKMSGSKQIVSKAFYKIGSIYSDGTQTYATLSAVSTESGNQPTIMVHGLNSNTSRWGFDKLWQNDDNIPEADEYINSYESFTGREYSNGYDSSYGNYDVHYLGDAGDQGDLGWQLNLDFYYTPNVDLFGFNYEHNGHVGEGAAWLRHYIGDLESLGYINSYDDINLVAHSKGGLISRYLIENLGYSYYVDRLMTFGTPHFGSDRVFFGTDMDRFGSELWGTDSGDDYCNQFTNNHDFTLYFAVGAWEKDDVPNNIENRWILAPNLNGTPNHVYYSYHQDVTDLFNQSGMFFSSTPEIHDTWVNIDTALGSDDDKMDNNGISPGTLPKVNMHKRWYLFDEVYGNHSEMTEHADADNETYMVLSGQYD
ncbi:triacylglycerol lipase [Alkalihalobacillus sp. AL-G]|uniref:esterase/lipase family protein n=1 Tax=Alkalihalobacillus sp. AL-G TaxID=2926399 RepID=UPI00272A3530|nr:hypothetical protein [Alkalihalobacillus sp. AL-G]WLD92620.1 hypothetical protein MOJ78_16615 [Alkalihalobacillus sp. AL-G]